MEQKPKNSTFRPDIEGLRGIAVLLVVAFHCGIPGFAGGFIGVDVFFVLSGYLITGLLVTEVQRSSRLDLVQFYARRVRRLLPASALVLLLTLLACGMVLAPQELAFAGRAGRATAVYMSNVFFSSNAADYFAPDVARNPLLHTWSLAVEEQFYLVWPLLIMAGLVWLRSKKALVALLAGLTTGSLAASVWLTANAATFAFYQLPARAWEFGIGGLAVLLPSSRAQVPKEVWRVVGYGGLAAVLWSGYGISVTRGFPGWIATIPAFGTVAALIAGSEDPHGGVGLLLESAPLQQLGTHSYSWYLWHWPFLVLAGAVFPNISTAGRLTAAVVALAVAAVTHRLIENPIRFHPQLIRRPVLSLSLAAVVTLGTLGVSWMSIRTAASLADAPEMKRITAAVTDIADMPREQCVSLGTASDVKSCVFGDAASAVNIVLFGDSHAIQWFNPLEQIVKARRWKLTTMVKSGCPATTIDIGPAGGSPAFAASCVAWRTESIRRIVASRPAVVLVGNATNWWSRKSQISPDRWRDGTRRTLEPMATAGLRVVLMRDTPEASFDIPTCLARLVRHSWYPASRCQIDRRTSVNAAAFAAEEAGARNLPNVTFVDLTERLCQKEVCMAAAENGEIIYRDNNHLTGSFAASLAPLLDVELQSVLRNF